MEGRPERPGAAGAPVIWSTCVGSRCRFCFPRRLSGASLKKNIHSSAVLSVNLIDVSGVKFRYSPLP